jgi:hypothetical protein
VIDLTTGAIACTRDFGEKQFREASQLYSILARQFKITHTYSDPRLGPEQKP